MHRAQRQGRKDLASMAHSMEVTRVELQLSGDAFGTTMALVKIVRLLRVLLYQNCV